jgi:hypothetical protein
MTADAATLTAAVSAAELLPVPSAPMDKIISLETRGELAQAEVDALRFEAAKLISDVLAEGMTQRELGTKIGKSQQHVSIMARLHKIVTDYPGSSDLGYTELYRRVKDGWHPGDSDPPPHMYDSREGWLLAAVEHWRGIFAEVPALQLPEVVQVTMGRVSSRACIGHCERLRDGTPYLTISHELSDPVRILDVLGHELMHAALPNLSHKQPFGRIARSLGIRGSGNGQSCR